MHNLVMQADRKARMSWKQWLIALCICTVWAAQSARAGDWKINIPRRSKPTPVQSLNRQGVDAVRKHDFEKAKSLFYRAYLLDPDDPFTLNNLGYMSEIEGQVEQAQAFYSLASRQGTDAVVDRASTPHMEGQPFLSAVSSAHNVPLEVNRANIAAVRLLSEGRASEAELLLQHAIALDQRNPFTLNNLGVVKEMEGDFEGALMYYRATADLHSAEPVIVTQDSASKGRAVSEIAADTAKKLSHRMNTLESSEERAGLLNLRGVSAINRNDPVGASKDFLQAYALDPNSAFSLNNLGYLAELTGDLETAQVFYERARLAQQANARIGLATRRSAEGVKLFQVADQSNQKVGIKIEQQSEAHRRETGPIVLKRRDGKPVDETPQPAEPQHPSEPQNNELRRKWLTHLGQIALRTPQSFVLLKIVFRRAAVVIIGPYDPRRFNLVAVAQD
jgi:Flp pilus assembly protein TadD